MESKLKNIKAEILSDKGKAINFEKLHAIIEHNKELERKKKEELAFYLKAHMENLENARRNIKSNLDNIENIQTMIVKAKQVNRTTQKGVDIDQKKIEALLSMRKNLNTIIDKLGDFLNISNKLEEMYKLVKDEDNFITIQNKLDNLFNLRSSIVKTSKNQENISKFLQKFEEVDEFQTHYIEKVLSIFERYLELSRNNPNAIKNAIEIIKRNDASSNSKQFSKRMKTKFEEIVEKRFDKKLGGKKDINEILEKMGFSVNDLLVIYENVVPLFDEEYAIFQFLETCYKDQIKNKILPFLKNLDFLKENPGTLIFLINWLDSYEKLLTKVGFSIKDFEHLREKAKSLMPIFFKHVSSLLLNFLKKIDSNDDFLFKEDFEGNVLETETPEDTASFLNQQVDFLGSHLQGEQFNKLFQVWAKQLTKHTTDTVT